MVRTRPLLLTALGALLATVAFVSVAAMALAAPAVNGEFALGGTPHALTLGPDGNVWVALDGVTFSVAKVTPDGTVTNYTTTGITHPVGIATGPDGNLWVTQSGGVARFSPATPTTATAFPVAGIVDPRGIVSGPDGNLWAASGDQAIKITTAGVATPFTVTGMGARGIASGGDGKLYIADFGGHRVVSLTTAGVATFVDTAPGGGPQEVAAGPSNEIAFTDPTNAPQQIGRFTPGGTPATVDVPMTDPFGITFAADGAYWIADFAVAKVTRFGADGSVTQLSGLSAASGPRSIAAGVGGTTLWVALETAQKVARISGVEAPAPVPPVVLPLPKVPPVLPKVRDVTAPRLSVLVPARVGAGKRLSIRFTLSEAATVTLRFQRRLAGRKAGKQCVAPRRGLRHAKRCTRLTRGVEIARGAKAGTTTLHVGPRIGGRLLAAGSYRVTIVARDAAGNRGRARRTVLTIVAAR